jgi:hypothetical protein
MKLYIDEVYNGQNGTLLWSADVFGGYSGGTTYTINKYASNYDDNSHNILLCENDGSWSVHCQGDDDVLIWHHQATFTNIDTQDRNLRYDGNTGSEQGSGYLRWQVSNHYYHGDIDELRLYNYALDTDEVKELYDSATRALEMPLDEAPGRSIFRDNSGNNLTGTCSGTTCPDSGIPGRSNQTLRFDGSNDYVDVTIDVPENGYALALWFKTDCATCGLYSVDDGIRGANGNERHLYLSNGRLCARVWAEEVICTPAGTSYANNQWHHLVHTFGAGNGQRIFVDGVQRATGSKAQSDFTWQSGINIGFSNDVSPSYFRGLIDQVTIVKKYLSQSEVQALMLETPVLNLHLDESLGATTFSDSSNFANNGSCTGNACPQAAVKGQMREGLVFDGQNDLITVADSSSLDLTTFSVCGSNLLRKRAIGNH